MLAALPSHAPDQLTDRVALDDAAAAVARLAADGWQIQRFPTIDVRPPVDWEHIEATHRSWAFLAHSWTFLQPLLVAHHRTGEPELLRWALDVVADWRAHEARSSSRTHTWYDMAVGLRAPLLAWLLLAAARDPAVEAAEVDRLRDLAVEHLDELAAEDTFAGHSNHGLYQAAGHLALATRVPVIDPGDIHRALALTRVRAMIDRQFTVEGVHREHSPGYHRMVLDTLSALVDHGLLDDEPALRARIADCERALAWFTLPDGHLVTFGDTARRALVGEPATGGTPELRFVRTAGGDGTPPPDGLQVLPASGYAIHRADWHDPRSSYLAFNAAFHSRTHKHADDLSVVWSERGQEVLIDPGPYGYGGGRIPKRSELGRLGFWYDDPRRIYVESTRAHNCVEIDGRSYDRRGRAPFGSALGRTAAADGVVAMEAEVRHGPVHHVRCLVLRPGAWLLLVDWLRDDTGRDSHRFSQRFHAAPGAALVATGDKGLRLAKGDLVCHLTPLLDGVRREPVFEGREEPELLGWASRDFGAFDPAPTSAYTALGPTHTFATLCHLDTEVVPARARCDADVAGRRVRLAWRSGPHDHRVELRRPLRGDLVVTHRTD